MADELSEDELKVLNELEESERKVTSAEPAAPEPAAPAAAEAPAPAAAPAAEPAAVVDDAPAGETRAQFIARHRDKTPEELDQLIENRDKRASREQFNRRRGRAPEAIAADRLKLAERAKALTSSDFDAKLAEDPDAAARMLHERQIERDRADNDRALAALDDEEHNTRLDAAIDMGQKYIPDFEKTYVEMRSFGEAIGYTPEELNGISDGRDLIVLNLARVAGQLMQAKVIDVRGNLLPQVQPVATAPTDPRLTAPAAPATHTAPGSAAAPAQSVEERIASAVRMPDADFAKLTDAEIEKLLA